VFPIGIILLFAIATGWEILRPENKPGPPGPPETALSWARETAMAWEFPLSALGRYLIAAFTAVAFGGEYGWNTWKLVAPHRSRTSMLLSKYLVVSALFFAAFVLLALLMIGGAWLNARLTGDAVPRGVTAQMLWDAHSRQALMTLIVTALTVGYASAAAVLTRSTMAGAIIAIVVITAESAGRLLLAVSAFAYHWTPTHHLANLKQWIGKGSSLRIPLERVIDDHWAVSLTYVGLLTALLVVATFAVFRDQDLN
jgi:ABC-type transport system involved in multi-copper enzyme maturation permease subunit